MEKQKEAMDGQKSPSVMQCVEAMRNFFEELQCQTKKGHFGRRRMAPIGIFCMSGPVAHVDDEDGDEDYEDAEYEHSDDCVQKAALNFILPSPEKPSFPRAKNNDAHCSPKYFQNGSDIPEDLCSEQVLKCRWPDGCTYEGDGVFDKGSGRGKIYWPTGSSYEGEFMGGHLNGVGTYRGADGSIYKGNWILNRKHGFGRKKYANGDVYEGTWKWDLPEGQGCYFWSNGSEYYGSWKGGLMSGRGVLVWESGDTYDGQWLNGMPDGRGVYTWEDGSTYFGTWRRGLKHGEGRFYPPGSKYVETERLHHAFSLSEDSMVMQERVNSTSQTSCRQKICSPSHLPQELRRLGQRPSLDDAPFNSIATSDNNEAALIPLERLSNVGTCECFIPGQCSPANHEWAVDTDEHVFEQRDAFLCKGNVAGYTLQCRERKGFGETIYKGHRSYDLMLNLQLGIRYSTGKSTQENRRKLLPFDFGPKSRLKISFPKEGSQFTPPHQSDDFKWKDYCPLVFRHLRETFKIDSADYMLSICGNAGLRELSSPGKSGSVFYLSQDERFIIKTLRKAEVKVLLKMLPQYYNHVQMHRNTLLTKFFGLHRIKPAGGQKVRFIVMGNVVSTETCIHRRFDLKGSSHGRFTDKHEADEGTTLKDLDLDFVFQLHPASRSTVLEQISRDCQFLESENIMDYSLLLGLHFKDASSSSLFSNFHYPVSDSPSRGTIADQKLAAMGDIGNAISDRSSLHSLRPNQIGHHMLAKAHRQLGLAKDGVEYDEVYDVILYFGIIDILQEYDVGKRIEHAYKSWQFDAFTISAVDPTLYSKRFQHFISGVFPAAVT